MQYLLKTEPSVYSFANLQKEQSTIWDGVTNPFAVKNLRNMQKGDHLIIYHTGDEKTAVGTATVESVDISDPKVPKVRIKVGQPVETPYTGRNQSPQDVRGIAARSPGTAVGGPAHRRAVQVADRLTQEYSVLPADPLCKV